MELIHTLTGGRARNQVVIGLGMLWQAGFDPAAASPESKHYPDLVDQKISTRAIESIYMVILLAGNTE